MIMNEVISVVFEHKKALGGVVVLVSMMGLYTLGKQHGKVPHVQECSKEIIQERKLKLEKEELQKKLSTCETSKVGNDVLLCFDSCDLRVRKALEDAKAWACED